MKLFRTDWLIGKEVVGQDGTQSDGNAIHPAVPQCANGPIWMRAWAASGQTECYSKFPDPEGIPPNGGHSALDKHSVRRAGKRTGNLEN